MNVLGKRPSPPRSASCQQRPWPRRECAASRSGPSTSRQEPCRPRLPDVRVGSKTAEKTNIPNLIPGLSSRTFSRCSLAKNMYAERPRLGALGSIESVKELADARELLTLLLLAAVGLGLGRGLAGGLLLGHDVWLGVCMAAVLLVAGWVGAQEREIVVARRNGR
jgi:hypothetical protein